MQKEGIISSSDNNKLGIIVHVLGILTFFVGPLIVKNLSKSTSAKLNAKNALNWQINFIIYLLTGLILTVVLVGHIIIFVTLILNITFSIIAAIKASKNELWDYPFSFQFLE